ncbi:MAG: hypothetical protein OEW19_00350 [Acidobacteriota bacterium]|nr:hypothetical protein [Acidobacteriota bacterium]
MRAGDYLFVGGDFGGVSPADRHTGPFAVFVPPSEIPLPLPPIRGESAAATAVVDDGQGGLIVGGQFAVAGPVTLCLLAPTTCAP